MEPPQNGWERIWETPWNHAKNPEPERMRAGLRCLTSDKPFDFSEPQLPQPLSAEGVQVCRRTAAGPPTGPRGLSQVLPGAVRWEPGCLGFCWAASLLTGPDWLLNCTHNTCGPETSPGASRSPYPVPLSLLSNSNAADGSGAKWASVCALRTGFVYILPLKLSGPQLLLGRLGPR